MEKYKILEDYPNYQISNYGNIKYKNKLYNNKYFTDKDNNIYFGIYNDNNENEYIDVKKICEEVAKYFLPENKNKNKIIKHLDNNKNNNNVNNLYYFKEKVKDKIPLVKIEFGKFIIEL